MAERARPRAQRFPQRVKAATASCNLLRLRTGALLPEVCGNACKKVSDNRRWRQPYQQMNERRKDFELLQVFAREGDQGAFADVVRQHINLVFATALRKLEDHGAAQEIAQNVFVALARKAWRFARGDSVPAWLHKTTLLECKEWLRGELRRRRREGTAAELETTMKTPTDEFASNALTPLLDEALLSLREGDRTVLLRRYYEDESVRDIASACGVNEVAAQKRVERALERLSRFFQRRGFKTASVAAAAAVLKGTATTVSAETTAAVLVAAWKGAPPALTGFGALLSRLAAWSKAQTAAVCVVLAFIPVTWQWTRAREVRTDLTALQTKSDSLRTQQEDVVSARDRLRVEADRLEELRRQHWSGNGTNEQAALRLQNVRERARAALAADRYRWPDDLPFVRIPKSAVSSLTMAGGPTTPAGLQDKIRRFLDLSAMEREAVDQVFSNYFAGIDQLIQMNLYETNQGTRVKLPADAESRVFVLLPTGPGIRSALEALSQSLLDTLGEEHWRMVQPNTWEMTHYEQVRLLGYTQHQWDIMQELAVNVFTNTGEPNVSFAAGDGTGASWTPAPGRMPLRSYLSGRYDPLSQGPPAVANAVKQYLASAAKERLPETGK
jgi:RNA polymerase sigma factor (sigma-70 family)